MPEPHLSRLHPLERLIHLVDTNDLDLRLDVVRGAELQDLLRLRQPADEGSGNASSMKPHLARVHSLCQLTERADDREDAVAPQAREIRIDVVAHGNRRKDEIEAPL